MLGTLARSEIDGLIIVPFFSNVNVENVNSRPMIFNFFVVFLIFLSCPPIAISLLRRLWPMRFPPFSLTEIQICAML